MYDPDGFDLMVAIVAQPGFDNLGIDAMPPVSLYDINANWPTSNIRILSPGESVFVRAPSHAPDPDDGKITTFPEVWKISFIPSKTSSPKSPHSGPR